MVLVGFKPDLWRPTGFLQCFDTVGLVIWPLKIVPKMTYYVSSGTLNPTHSLTHSSPSALLVARNPLSNRARVSPPAGPDRAHPKTVSGGLWVENRCPMNALLPVSESLRPCPWPWGTLRTVWCPWPWPWSSSTWPWRWPLVSPCRYQHENSEETPSLAHHPSKVARTFSLLIIPASLLTCRLERQ